MAFDSDRHTANMIAQLRSERHARTMSTTFVPVVELRIKSAGLDGTAL
jgi:hypothetical protein